MNSTFRRTPSARRAAEALLFGTAVLMAGPAFAQSPSAPQLNIPGAASAPPPVVQQQMLPPQSRPAIVPPPAPSAIPAPVSMPVPQQIVSPPSPDVRRATNNQVPLPPAAVPRDVDGALDRQHDLGLRRLQQVAPESLSPADTAASANELDQMANRQRRIRELKMINDEAEQTKKLYTTMKEIGDLGGAQQQPAQANARPAVPQISEADIARRVEEAQKRGAEEERQKKVREENSAVRPVVASIAGAAGERSAILLVPYVGEMTVQVGSLVPEGMRVTEISEKGVEVVQKGKRFNLGFGDSVPRFRQQAGNFGPGNGITAAPIMNQPLPIGGGGGGNPRLPPVAVPMPGVQSPSTFVR